MAKTYVKREPDENVEYTFVFPGKKVYTYLYYATNEKDRFVLYNVTTKTFTTMSRGWFFKLCKTQLLSKREVDGAKPKTPAPLETAKKTAPAQVLKESNSDLENRIISELRSLSGVVEMNVTALIGRSPKALADDMECLKNFSDDYSDEYVNRVMGEMFKARAYYLQLAF